jgi:hypothetical protein
MTTTERKIGFTVDGRWLADFARTRMDEGAWDRALSLLTDSLEGLSIDQAIAILKGEADLIGNSRDAKGIRLRKLKTDGKLAKARQERMQFMYGDCFRMGDEIWKPYALVSGWGKDDYDFARHHSGPYKFHSSVDVMGDVRKKIGALRSIFYADSPQEDMLVRIPERWNGDYVVADVLCKRVIGSPPFWYKVPTNDAANFIDNLLKHRELPVRGAMCQRVFGDRYDKRDIDPDDAKITDMLVAVEDDLQRVSPIDASDDAGEKAMKKQRARELILEVLGGTKDYLEMKPTDLKEIGEMDRIFERGVDVLRHHIDGDEWDLVEKLRKDFTTAREAILREKVNAQAEERGGFIELPLFTKDNRRYGPCPYLKVPRNPFLIWTMRANFNFADHGIDLQWDYVAGMGYKMQGDDPSHTDWMLGAGVPLSDTYDHDEDSFGEIVRRSAYQYKDTLVKKHTGRKFTILTRPKDRTWISGEIVHAKPGQRVPTGSVAIAPTAGPDYQFAMETANMEKPGGGRGCIICETGGKLAHLTTVGREYDCVVLMIPDALKLYRPGQRVIIDLEAGTIEHAFY